MDAAVVAARRLPRATLVLGGVRAIARVGAEAVVPGLPGVAVDESEPACVRLQPRVGAGRPEVELGAVAMQRRARRRHPLRVRVRREQARLLGVRAKAAGDRQRVPVPPRGGRHAVERERDVRPHRLAHPVCERAVVAAAGAARREAEHRVGRRAQLRSRPGLHRHSPAPARPRTIDIHPHGVADAHPDPRGSERHTRERDVAETHSRPVSPRPAHRRCARPREIDRQRHVPRVGRAVGKHRGQEQARVVALHRARCRHRGQVRRPLRRALAAERLAERREDQHPGEQRRHHAEHQQEGLP